MVQTGGPTSLEVGRTEIFPQGGEDESKPTWELNFWDFH